jgi:hypothetical protein
MAFQSIRPRTIERAITQVKFILNRGLPTVPWWSICPACHFQPIKPDNSISTNIQRKLRTGTVFNKFISTRQPRWIGMLFQKAF